MLDHAVLSVYLFALPSECILDGFEFAFGQFHAAYGLDGFSGAGNVAVVGVVLVCLTGLRGNVGVEFDGLDKPFVLQFNCACGFYAVFVRTKY